jgi:outer membrane protein OmpA-like peptidoglycan-associated protein
MDVPAGKPVDIQAQTPEMFFDKVRVAVPDSGSISQPLALPITFVLRVNFPTAIFDAPYEHTLDSNGMETVHTWQGDLDALAANVKISGPRLKRLVLIGHTDDVDTDENNLVLGRNRVNFIIDQLVARGVDRSLLEGRSAGESLLPGRRKDESLIMWRKRARRVELVKVMEQ